MINECSTNRIQAALCGRLSGADEHELLEHLSRCDECNAAMERLVGGPDFCDQTASYLTDDPLDDETPKRDEWSAVDFSVEQLEPSDDPSLLGRIGGYDVLEIIGQGGMGIVLKAFDPELKRYVAIKALSPHLGNSSLARKRFAREAQAAAAVVNPHVIAIHQVQPNGRLPFLVMSLLGGESLAQRLQTRGRLELTEVLRIGMQAAAGLAAAHEQGLVHRDVKPANILLEKGIERAVLTDFGLARAADDMSMTRWGVIAGTPQYMSPEQARGENLDGRSDLFSLGCVLYEMASGVSPFKASSTVAVLRRVVDEKPQSLAALNSELPKWFVEIVERLLAKNPADRFESAKEVSELLERCLAHVHQPAVAPLPWRSKTSKTRRLTTIGLSPRWPLILCVVMSVVVIATIVSWSPTLFSLTPQQSKAASESNLNRLTAALAAYEQEKGHYPSSVVYGKDGQGGPPHSWRVEILPYLGYKTLYKQYHMDEAWDSPHNQTVLAKMPDVYRAPQADRRTTNASYFGVILEDLKPLQDRTNRLSVLSQGLAIVRVTPRAEGTRIEFESKLTHNSNPPELTSVLKNGVKLSVDDNSKTENSQNKLELSADRMIVWSDRFGMYQELTSDQKYQIYLEGNVVVSQASEGTMRADRLFFDMGTRHPSLIKTDSDANETNDDQAFLQRGVGARQALGFLPKGTPRKIDVGVASGDLDVESEPIYGASNDQQIKAVDGDGDTSATILKVARDELKLATQKLQFAEELNSKGAASKAELSRAQLDVEQARIQVADAEGDEKAVLLALDEIVKLQGQVFEREKRLHESGAASQTDVNEAEILYLEAKVHLASAKLDHLGLRQALEKIVAVRARTLEYMIQVANAGQIPRIEVSKAETDWKLARALFKAVEQASGSTFQQSALEGVSDAPDLNRIHSHGSNLTDVLGNRVRCDACHQGAQLESWNRKRLSHAKQHATQNDASYRDAVQRGIEFLSSAHDGQIDKMNRGEWMARHSAIQQWQDLSRSHLQSSSDSEKRMLIRRIYLDLTGRLPTTNEVSNLLSKDSTEGADQVLRRLWEESLTAVEGTIADGLFVPSGSTLFSRPAGARQIEIIDGTANTIAIVECKREIPWTKPEDINWDSKKLGQSAALGGWHSDGWFAGMADGRARFVDRNTTSEQIRTMLTISGGEEERSNQQTITPVDGPARKHVVVQLKHRKAAEVAKAINELLKLDSSEGANARIVAEETGNALLISAFAGELETIQGLIRAIDLPLPQNRSHEGYDPLPFKR